MNKPEHIQYWILAAEKDWEVVWSLFQSGQFSYSLFFAHLTLEKLLKGLWVKDNEVNYPPRTHSLVRICEGTRSLFKIHFKICNSLKTISFSLFNLHSSFFILH